MNEETLRKESREFAREVVFDSLDVISGLEQKRGLEMTIELLKTFSKAYMDAFKECLK